VGAAFVGTVPGALVGDVAGRSGIVVAVFNMSSDLGVIIGPVLAGFLVDQTSYTVAFGLSAGVVVAAGLVAFRIREPVVSPWGNGGHSPGMGKQMEGDNKQRRKRAREAREDEGVPPSQAEVTLGASSQREHLPGKAPTEERQHEAEEGKQRSDVGRGPHKR
jgi:MFS family permease